MPYYVAFDKSRPKPAWLDAPDPPGLCRNTIRGRKWYRLIWTAQPPWANVAAIRRVYRRARALRAAGHAVEVDHIVPLNHPYVCGLHVENNLRITDKDLNQSKSNHWYPGQPCEQLALFHATLPPADFTLGEH